MGSDDQRPPWERESGAVEETESVERYRRAHDIIERMRADQRPDRSGATDDDPQLDVTAALLRSAAPGASDVAPDFAARLFARLEGAQAEPESDQSIFPRPVTGQTPEKPAHSISRPRPKGVSRRGLMLGGLTAAAAAVIGGAAGAALEATTQPPSAARHPTPPQSSLVMDGVGSWVAVAKEASLPLGAVIRFETDAIIGYLRHTEAGFVALSGVCTHMACLLQWNGVDRTFDCPCHGSRFLESGQQAPGAPYDYPPLPNIKTKVEQGQVWVYVISATGSAPANSSAPPSSTPSGRYGD